MFKQSKLPIKKETIVCVDTGYLGLAKLHDNTEMPKKRTKLNPLSKADKQENKKKSSKRIPVEHVNAKIKAFKIVAQKYGNRRKRFGLRTMLPFFKTSKSSFLIPPFYDTSGNSFSPLESKLFIAL